MCVCAVAPDILVLGYDGDWYVGRENVQLKCRAKANPPAQHLRWIRCVTTTLTIATAQHVWYGFKSANAGFLDSSQSADNLYDSQQQ